MTEKRLLACFAHPDDEAFPVGGVLAAHANNGVEVRLITATLGEEGEIRKEGAATKQTLGEVRRVELAAAVDALGLAGHTVLDYRDSGMAGDAANSHPRALVNAEASLLVERLVLEIRSFRPQVVLTFEPGGLYGHPDHIAICQHTTRAFHLAADPNAYPDQLAGPVAPHRPDRLFYSARPKGFRRDWAQRLRQAGVDTPLPPPERAEDGTPPEDIHLDLDLSDYLEHKINCILCHRTQVGPDWPYLQAPRAVTASILGREQYIRAHPPVSPGEAVPEDFFRGL